MWFATLSPVRDELRKLVMFFFLLYFIANEAEKQIETLKRHLRENKKKVKEQRERRRSTERER